LPNGIFSKIHDVTKAERMPLHVLAIEPFYGGSHRSFLDGWVAASRHQWQLLTYSAHHWKWRMRHSAVSAADWFNRQCEAGHSWDVVFCSSMLDLATWRGLLAFPAPPVVYYVHENQLTYPNRGDAQRDLHFAFTNWTSMLAADAVWFNSLFHQQDWRAAIGPLLERMPDSVGSNVDRLADIQNKCRVHSPGIRPIGKQDRDKGTPLSIVWAARWEHDKRPDRLLELVVSLVESGCDFRLSVLGQSFADVPPALAELRQRFIGYIEHWGTVSRDEYRAILSRTDVFVSTADHEFFGISAVEAMSAGNYPMLPNRLAYPELVGELGSECLYTSHADLVAKLNELVARKRDTGSVWADDDRDLSHSMERYSWEERAAAMDADLERYS
jgi:glycosyltransferase involved in cell wall biosynthesis